MSDHLPSRRRAAWPWISLVPLGFGAWAPIMAGARAHVQRWVWLGQLPADVVDGARPLTVFLPGPTE